MATVELTWIEGRRFLGVDSEGHEVALAGGDAPGVRPVEALLLALAACAAYDIVAILEKQRHDLRRLTIAVEGEQSPERPWPYRRIHLRVAAAAVALRAEQLARAVDLALNNYCSVRASLHPDIAVSFEVAVAE